MPSKSKPDKAKDPISDLKETIDKIKLLGGEPYLPIIRSVSFWNDIQIEIDLTKFYLSQPPKYRVFASDPEMKQLFPQRYMTWDEWISLVTTN